nr:hypothetical protein [Tanacetum cinerariifolium]
MSTPAYVDSETITQADGAQSSRVPVPLPSDPYVAVRQAQLVDTDTESDLEEAPSEAEESQPLDSTAPLSPDRPLTHVSPTSTPTRASFHRRTVRMAVRTQPTLSPGMSARIAEATTLSPSSFIKRYRPSYATSSSSSLTLPVRKRYRGTYELILDTDSNEDKLREKDTGEDESSDKDDERQRLEDEGPGFKGKEEEVVPEGQQQIVLAADIAVGEPLGLSYEALRRRELAVEEDRVLSTLEVGQSFRVYIDIPAYVPPVAPVQTPPSPEWSFGSFPISPSSLVVLSPLASPVALSIATILRHGRVRLMPKEQLLWHAIYDFQKENHDLRMQLAKERRERLELADHIARMERR